MIDLRLGDCLDVLPTLAAGSIDACVCDPPYGLKFMGQAWDHGVPGVPFWAAIGRMLKPGAVLMAFGGNRTYHRLVCAIEDAGFPIEDSIHWINGQGFPKHKSKLKPAHEPIVVARKPGPKWLGVKAGRLPTVPECKAQPVFNSPTGRTYGMKTGEGRNGEMSQSAGRWPPNLAFVHHFDCQVRECVEGCPVATLDRQGGTRTSGKAGPNGHQRYTGPISEHRVYGNGRGLHTAPGPAGTLYGDSGSASRFYPTFAWEADDFAPFLYCPKAPKAERNAGLEKYEVKMREDLTPGQRSFVLAELRSAGVLL